MFARIVECTAKQEKGPELNNSIRNEIMPILQSQPGFLDEIILVSNTKPDQVVAISLWNRPDDATRYDREQFPQIVSKLQPLLKSRPRVKTFNVESSTLHKVTTAPAA
jgi:quinol monooxygenase YgiN